MTETRIHVHLELVLVQEFIVPRRMTTAATFHTTEVLGPSGSTRVLFQPFLFRSSAKIKKNEFDSKLITNTIDYAFNEVYYIL